jgi:hypothetical protein
MPFDFQPHIAGAIANARRLGTQFRDIEQLLHVANAIGPLRVFRSGQWTTPITTVPTALASAILIVKVLASPALTTLPLTIALAGLLAVASTSLLAIALACLFRVGLRIVCPFTPLICGLLSGAARLAALAGLFAILRGLIAGLVSFAWLGFAVPFTLTGA